jgi:hypothetical protein
MDIIKHLRISITNLLKISIIKHHLHLSTITPTLNPSLLNSSSTKTPTKLTVIRAMIQMALQWQTTTTTTIMRIRDSWTRQKTKSRI